MCLLKYHSISYRLSSRHTHWSFRTNRNTITVGFYSFTRRRQRECTSSHRLVRSCLYAVRLTYVEGYSCLFCNFKTTTWLFSEREVSPGRYNKHTTKPLVGIVSKYSSTLFSFIRVGFNDFLMRPIMMPTKSDSYLLSKINQHWLVEHLHLQIVCYYTDIQILC